MVREIWEKQKEQQVSSPFLHPGWSAELALQGCSIPADSLSPHHNWEGPLFQKGLLYLHQLLSERPSATVPSTTSFPARLSDCCVIHRPTACISPALAPHTGTSLGATPEISYHNAIFFLLLLFSHPVIAGSLQPHGLQHSRPPCPSPSPRVCPSPRSLHQ